MSIEDTYNILRKWEYSRALAHYMTNRYIILRGSIEQESRKFFKTTGWHLNELLAVKRERDIEFLNEYHKQKQKKV